MNRKPMKLYGRVVLTTKRINELNRLHQQQCLTDLDNENRIMRIKYIMRKATLPIWSFLKTISEATSDVFIMIDNKKVKRVKCLGLFRCRQTGECKEFNFYQTPVSTHRGLIS